MLIRREAAADRSAADGVHRRAFSDDGATIAQLLSSLRAMPPSKCDLAMVAEQDGAIVASALCTRSLLDAPRRLVEVAVRRLGFVPGGPLGFRKPSLRTPDEAFQVVRLPAHEEWMNGTVVYAHEFWDHDCVGLRDPQA